MLMFALLLVFAAVVCFMLVFRRCDGDILLMWKEKFGHNIDCLSGQVVWITGASSGTGEAMAYFLAGAGCKIILSAPRTEELQKVKDACLRIGQGKLLENDILMSAFDVADFTSHTAAVQKVIDNFKKIDILVNNAGTSENVSWLDVDLEVDRQTFDLNILGPVSLTQLVLPHMMARGKGQVVVTSSLSAKTDSRSHTRSKFAINGYFDDMRTELGHRNVGITVICPGPVFSNLFVNFLTSKAGELFGRKMDPCEKKLTMDRCAYLCCVAIANRLCEAWVSEHPSLFFNYMSQYIPDLMRWPGVAQLFAQSEDEDEDA